MKISTYPLKSAKNQNFVLLNIGKQMVPCKSTAEEVSFERSHHKISSTDSKVYYNYTVSIIDSRSERVNPSVDSVKCNICLMSD